MQIHGPGPGDPAVVEIILRVLPEWFGLEQSLRDYVTAAPELDTWTVAGDGEVVGFLCIKRHFPQTAEVHVMGVLPQCQRRVSAPAGSSPSEWRWVSSRR